MSRRGNPYDNAKAQSFMKTLKVEAVYLMAYETFEEVTADLPRFIDGVYKHPQFRARLSEPRAIRGSTRPATCQNRRLKLSTIRGALHQRVKIARRMTRSRRRVRRSPTRAVGVSDTGSSCDRRQRASSQVSEVLITEVILSREKHIGRRTGPTDPFSVARPRGLCGSGVDVDHFQRAVWISDYCLEGQLHQI
jgi:hypothetical protein